MKLAILLTGQLRTFDMVKFSHMNTILSQYDCDVFLSIDLQNLLQCEYKNTTNETHSDIVKHAISFFNPIDYFTLYNFDDEFNNIKNKTHEYIDNFQLLFRQYYIVKHAYGLLINHINKTNTKYDIIMRLRFDQLLWTDDINLDGIYNNKLNTILYNKYNTELLNRFTKDKKIIFKEVPDNTIYIFGFGDFLHYKYANDQFFYHNDTILNNIFNFYDNILNLMLYCFENKIGNKGALIECIFYLYLKNNNIDIKLSTIKGIFIRENI